jgi:hypothetical protein
MFNVRQIVEMEWVGPQACDCRQWSVFDHRAVIERIKMMRKLPGAASRTIKASTESVWEVAASLNWLVGWSDITFLAPPETGSAFTLYDEHRPFRARFTRFEAPIVLAWRAADGSSGSLQLTADGDSTLVTWESVEVPHALIDRIAVNAMALLMPGRVKKLTDEDASKDLRILANLVIRRHPVGKDSPQDVVERDD